MTLTTLQEAAAKLMEAMQDEADLAQRKDQALLDALAKSTPKQRQQEDQAPTPEDRSEGAAR
ncbi:MULTISPECIES: hypothetical protein [unclassified Mesorhizobium]|uniref:hypothetical protein n=1 Tax=unclassified Mesorhizobium TaxID=325217 RepID=UPI000F75B8C8|nr:MULTISPECIES: hypothetical protein [unclassified Mesorhizobium]AZO75359.1 hypothetical protein EJ067_32415 [Mesorhizobium sp. M1D.F.Ca.ET.043.01.1.1]RWA87667.1 MAG: hypothetical protein EOQ32_23975 [Mesorhizobium sp.]